MSGTVGTAKKTSAWLQDFCYIFAHLSNVVTVKKYMIGNDQIKGANPWRNVVTVKSFEEVETLKAILNGEEIEDDINEADIL